MSESEPPTHFNESDSAEPPAQETSSIGLAETTPAAASEIDSTSRPSESTQDTIGENLAEMPKIEKPAAVEMSLEEETFKENFTSLHELIESKNQLQANIQDNKPNENRLGTRSKSLNELNETSNPEISKSLSVENLDKKQNSQDQSVANETDDSTKIGLTKEMRQALRNKLVMARNKRFSLESPAQPTEALESWKKTLSNKLKGFEVSLILMEKEQENEYLKETLQRTLAFLKEKNHLLTEARQSIASLDETIKELRAELLEKETLQQQMYFEMFQKGRDSATFEFADEEKKAKVTRTKSESLGESNENKELRKQLIKTKFELEQLRRHQKSANVLFKNDDSNKSEIYFQFAKDTFYYYLTASGSNHQHQTHLKNQHLKALVDLFQYDESQLEKIRETVRVNSI